MIFRELMTRVIILSAEITDQRRNEFAFTRKMKLEGCEGDKCR